MVVWRTESGPRRGASGAGVGVEGAGWGRRCRRRAGAWQKQGWGGCEVRGAESGGRRATWWCRLRPPSGEAAGRGGDNQPIWARMARPQQRVPLAASGGTHSPPPAPGTHLHWRAQPSSALSRMLTSSAFCSLLRLYKASRPAPQPASFPYPYAALDAAPARLLPRPARLLVTMTGPWPRQNNPQGAAKTIVRRLASAEPMSVDDLLSLHSCHFFH